MTDLRDRFHALDDLRAPDLWHEIQERAAAVEQPGARPLSWALILVILLLAMAIGGAALVGSGVITLPVSVEASATPSGTPSSSSPVTAAPAWTGVGDMYRGRSGFTATLLLDGRVLVSGGNQVSGGSGLPAEATAETYDPATGHWRATASMQFARARHTATRLSNGMVLVVGGEGEAGTLDSAELYDPGTGHWTATGSMREARSGHTATLLSDGRVLVAGGSASRGNGPAFLASAELYDSATGTWTATGPMIETRGVHTATLLRDGTVLVVGGTGGIGPDAATLYDLASAELFDPRTATWKALGDMPETRCAHSATLLRDGTVLVAGGYPCAGSGEVLASALLFHPASGSWTATGDMRDARGGHTATLLDDGTVLLAGGFSNGDVTCGNVISTAELFDPASGAWSAAPAFRGHRYHHVATLLSDGSVLIAGGAPNICQTDSLASADLYIPGTGNRGVP